MAVLTFPASPTNGQVYSFTAGGITTDWVWSSALGVWVVDAAGAEGPRGSKGDKGDTGDTGPQGPTALTAVTNTASYTLVITDPAKIIEQNSVSATTVTVPPNSSVAIPIGSLIEVYRMGAGTVQILAGSGVTIRNISTGFIAAQYSTVSLRKRATDEWVLVGAIV